MNYIVFDLEATCWDKKDPSAKHKKNEIIEIGAVKLNEKLEIISKFESFVKPKLFPVLSNFCKDLTKITQEHVNEAQTFPEVLEEFKSWMGPNYVLCSWGHYDKNQFENDCRLHKLDPSWLEDRHISIKHQFMEMDVFKKSKVYEDQMKKRGKVSAGMMTGLKVLGLKHEGTHHRGIDDAENIAKIFTKVFNKLEFPENLNTRFDCVFENDYKGIYMDVHNDGSHVGFTFYQDFKLQGEVCLREEELDKLIVLLESYKKKGH